LSSSAADSHSAAARMQTAMRNASGSKQAARGTWIRWYINSH
jgi:hypothetical protein